MKIKLFLFTISFLPLVGFSQDTLNKSWSGSNETVFHIVDSMPLFPGGEQAMLRYVSRNFRYPRLAARDHIKGKIIIQFVVNETGDVESVKVARGVRDDVDQAGIDVVQSMPRWKPGIFNHRPVKVYFNLPINF